MKAIILEKIINQLAEDKVIDLSLLDNKTIVLSVGGAIDFCFYINQNKIFIFDEIKPADATINIGFNSFRDLLNKKNLQDLIREDKISIYGDIKVAQLLIDLLKQNTIKIKIKQMLPDVFINFSKKFKENIQSGELKDKIIDILIQPKIYK